LKKISSNLFFLRKIFPAIWFGFLVFFLVIALASHLFEKNIIFLVQPCLMAVIGYFVMKKLVWNLVDEVYDCGEYLLIKNHGLEDKVMLSSIMNVSAITAMNPPRVTLALAKESIFGTEITFSPKKPPFQFNFFPKNPIVEDLIIRVDAARSKRTV
jgi:hypothetical protein